MLREKYIQPMALYDRKEGDAEQLHKVWAYNDEVEDYITEERANSSRIVNNLFAENTALEDTLAKHLLTDSLGQHKNQKSKARLKERQMIEVAVVQEAKRQSQIAEKQQRSWQEEQDEYLEEKIDLEKYL